MSLLRDIQAAAIDGTTEITTVLRKAKVLAARLGNAEFEKWVDSELNGYPDRAALPSYRILPVTVEAHLRSFQTQWGSAPVMTSFLPDNLKSWGEECYFTQPISSLAATVIDAKGGKGKLQVQWPQEMAVTYGAKGYRGFECLGAWQVISVHSMVGIVDTVRNRILEFALKVEAQNPNAGEAEPNTEPIAPEKLQPLVQNIFYGSVGNLAQNGQQVHQSASVGVSQDDLTRLVRELSAHFEELDLDPHQRLRAQAQVDALAAEVTSGKPNPDMVHQAGKSLRTIIEGTMGNLIATAATQPTVWHWIHQELTNI